MTVQSKVLLCDVLCRIDRNESLYEIKKWYGWKRQRLYHYVNRLKKAGLIQLKYRSKVAFYELTSQGKVFVSRHLEYLNSSIRLHNVEFIGDLETEGSLMPEKEWNWNHTMSKLRRETNCTITWDHKSIRFQISNLFGTNAFEIFSQAKEIVGNIIKNLELDYQVKVSNLKLNRKPHFAIKNPIANEIVKNIELTTEDAKIDASEGLGEIDWFTPQGANDFLEMPKKVAQLESNITKEIQSTRELVQGSMSTLNSIANTILLQTTILKKLSERESVWQKITKLARRLKK